jgi:sucrose-6F-phosphate phosphohydrolase
MAKSPTMNIKAFATDLDGTLIPLTKHPQNQTDLAAVARLLCEHQLSTVFVTGRHYESVKTAMAEHALPQPDWIICDVGTTILKRTENGTFQPVDTYATHLAARISACPADEIATIHTDIPALRLQESEKQGPFKVSFYSAAETLIATTNAVAEYLENHNAPWSIISSVDPFNGDGLIDLLPMGVSKSYAIDWWAAQQNLTADQVIFAGDSGNDIAALTAGYRAIVVSNAAAEIVQQTTSKHNDAAWTDRLFLSSTPATSGVVEGLRHFLKSPKT